MMGTLLMRKSSRSLPY
ncbi:hypothetical protein HID58_055848 [Brassica napus]|uniref:Uncharacterized protein n=1 Tax=Brassica napus TaxID=3708 RepID=A0ABQ8ALJ0_BRANA|nr:hypothetical protein HID58_055848 [Brassica napus]